jgi:hypothetical protein
MQVHARNEFQIGIWIHRDVDLAPFLDRLDDSANRLMLAIGTVMATIPFDREYRHETLEADAILFSRLKISWWRKRCLRRKRLTKWSVSGFGALFHYTDGSCEVSEEDEGEEDSDEDGNEMEVVQE